jgi:8-oxo-dGTP diphosphatase
MKFMEKRIVRVGVQAVIARADAILLGQRKNAFQEGSWGLPGGHLEVGETLLEAAARELLEETGIVTTKLKVFCVTDPNPESGYHMQIGVEVLEFRGSPQIMEPEKCSALAFFPITQLPNPLFISSQKVIENFVRKQFYDDPYNTNSEK